eukprot:2858247-Prymnesium_polylepis.1
MVLFSLYVYGQFASPCIATWDAFPNGSAPAVWPDPASLIAGPACELNKRQCASGGSRTVAVGFTHRLDPSGHWFESPCDSSLYFASVIMVCMCSIAGGSLHAVRATAGVRACARAALARARSGGCLWVGAVAGCGLERWLAVGRSGGCLWVGAVAGCGSERWRVESRSAWPR